MRTAHKIRIKVTDNVKDAIIKMADGNPGGLNVMMDFMEQYGDEGMLFIMRLDEAGIYGSDIWLAYKDVCGQDLDLLRIKIVSKPDELVTAVRKAGGFERGR